MYIVWLVSPAPTILSRCKTVLTSLNSMALETGIFLSHAIWLWRVRHVRREAKKAGQTYDEFVALHPSLRLNRSSSPTEPGSRDVESGHLHSTETLVHGEKSSEDVKLPEKAVVRDQTGTGGHERSAVLDRGGLAVADEKTQKDDGV